ncbi:hypothetical protein AMATHDRAFT_140239 [Amanita thiersii Skay4041]|uniref:Uncharacterized protein n=1 Tax=Amanita thiersii Skay4041 TaxID=703135 RepID=A0A2A9NX94_9AGAR|nr:hypothetical protein AMATHDRAFT_140239 [Amanita thiersii Skay4041]
MLPLSSPSPNDRHSPPPPVITHHPCLLPVPTSDFVQSVAGAAHYSGSKLNAESPQPRRESLPVGDTPTDITAAHQHVLDDLHELYCCRPTPEILSHTWRIDAELENWCCKCRGYSEYAAQWFAFPKLYSHSETISMRVMSSTMVPNRLVFSQCQVYTSRFLSKKKTIKSIIMVELDEFHQIVRLTEQREGQGILSYPWSRLLKVANAKMTSWLIQVPNRAT